MKHIKLFKTESNYNNWLNSDKFVTPYISKNKYNNSIIYQPRIKYYDSEISYLESTGTQHIHTDIYGNNELGFEIKFNINVMYSPEDGQSASLFGSRINTGQQGYQLSTYNNGTLQFNSILNKDIYFNQINTDYIVKFITDKIYLNNVECKSINIDDQFSTPTYIYIFALSDHGQIREHFQGKIYYIKFFNRITLEPIAEYIPVRIGTTGYLFDKISKQLFGNLGTGDFILGEDI